MTGRRIGILGGTFDPIHRGHLDLAGAAEDALHLTDVLFLPSQTPPHRAQPHASGYHRFAMVALALAEQGRWQVSDDELVSPGPSYTFDTLRRFHARGYRADELVFIIGADAFAEIATWHRFPDVLDQAHFAVVARPGHSIARLQSQVPTLASRMVLATTAPDALARSVIFLIDRSTANVAATTIRERAASGDSLVGLVSTDVLQHIERHRLYQRRSNDAGLSARIASPRGNHVA